MHPKYRGGLIRMVAEDTPSPHSSNPISVPSPPSSFSTSALSSFPAIVQNPMSAFHSQQRSIGNASNEYHPMQQTQPTHIPPPISIDPLQYSEDLEKLRKLKETILAGQHPHYKPIPQPEVLAALYDGPQLLSGTSSPVNSHYPIVKQPVLTNAQTRDLNPTAKSGFPSDNFDKMMDQVPLGGPRGSSAGEQSKGSRDSRPPNPREMSLPPRSLATQVKESTASPSQISPHKTSPVTRSLQRNNDLPVLSERDSFSRDEPRPIRVQSTRDDKKDPGVSTFHPDEHRALPPSSAGPNGYDVSRQPPSPPGLVDGRHNDNRGPDKGDSERQRSGREWGWERETDREITRRPEYRIPQGERKGDERFVRHPEDYRPADRGIRAPSDSVVSDKSRASRPLEPLSPFPRSSDRRTDVHGRADVPTGPDERYPTLQGTTSSAASEQSLSRRVALSLDERDRYPHSTPSVTNVKVEVRPPSRGLTIYPSIKREDRDHVEPSTQTDRIARGPERQFDGRVVPADIPPTNDRPRPADARPTRVPPHLGEPRSLINHSTSEGSQAAAAERVSSRGPLLDDRIGARQDDKLNRSNVRRSYPEQRPDLRPPFSSDLNRPILAGRPLSPSRPPVELETGRPGDGAPVLTRTATSVPPPIYRNRVPETERTLANDGSRRQTAGVDGPQLISARNPRESLPPNEERDHRRGPDPPRQWREIREPYPPRASRDGAYASEGNVRYPLPPEARDWTPRDEPRGYRPLQDWDRGPREDRPPLQVWERERPAVERDRVQDREPLPQSWDPRDDRKLPPTTRNASPPRAWESPPYRAPARLADRLSDPYPVPGHDHTSHPTQPSRYNEGFPSPGRGTRTVRPRSVSPMHRPGLQPRPKAGDGDGRPSKRPRDDLGPPGYYASDRERRGLAVPYDYPPRPGSPGYYGIGSLHQPTDLPPYPPRDVYDRQIRTTPPYDTFREAGRFPR